MNIEVKYSSHYPLRHIAAKQRYGLSCLRRPLNERAQRYDYGARQYDPTAPRFITPDPLAEKYYSWNMYTYCINNPLRFIDPDGRFVEDPPGEEGWSNISPVIPPESFIGWGYNNTRNCLSLARMQIEKVGYTIGGGKNPTNLYPYNETKGVNKEQTEKAIDYITGALEQGIPVVVGVDDAKGSPNTDNTTDHFVVVVGMGNDDSGNYFRVYDNATSDRTEGTSSENKLYYNPESLKIEGQKQFNNSYSESVRCYIMSQVRESQKK